jgi:hypothetical protein
MPQTMTLSRVEDARRHRPALALRVECPELSGAACVSRTGLSKVHSDLTFGPSGVGCRDVPVRAYDCGVCMEMGVLIFGTRRLEIVYGEILRGELQ